MKNTTLLERPEFTSQSGGNFSPVRICEIEIGESLPDISATDAQTGQQYRRARCLVRLHTQPLGLADFTFETGELSPEEYAPRIWQVLGEQINAHLREDGLPEVTELNAAGLESEQTPRCLQERAAFLRSAPFASVVLCTRDRPDRLVRFLPSLLSQEYPGYEVIVVDNAPSTSATYDFIQQTYADEPKIRYVREDRPGLSSARNRGVVEARGELIAFTDDDVVVDVHWLVGLIRGFSTLENVACVTGLLLPLELETPAQFLFEVYGGFTIGFSQLIFDLHEHRWENPSYPYIAGACSVGTGASMAFTASFLKNDGGFDPALGAGSLTHGGEDLAMFLSVIIKGNRLVYEPASLAYHEHRSEDASLQKQIYGYGVGFTAYLTKIIIDSPLLILDCIHKFLHSLLFLARAQSPGREEAIGLPQELKRLKWKGSMRGPLAYIQSRRASGWTCKGLALAQASANATGLQEPASSNQSRDFPVERVRK
jgi:glycosyltransferase involved in cell wall biosynthesis